MSQLSTGFEFVFALVLMLGVLITVHEFGHFIVAKLCGVQVLKFSVGFGSPIGIGRFRLAWIRSGTEYVIAWLPLGGFVKLLGENPEDGESSVALADPARTLGAQPTWRKLAIYAAGPAMNLLLPVFILAGTLWVGFDRAAPVVGTVEPGSPAAEAGFLPGDRIVAVDGEAMAWWEEFDDRVREHPGDTLKVEIQRDGQLLARPLTVERRAGVDVFFKESDIGWVGLQHHRQRALLGIPDLDSPAARAGLHSGDRVVAVGEQSVENWNEFAQAYAAQPRGAVTLRIVRAAEDAEPAAATDEPAAEREQEVRVPALGNTRALGIIPAVVLVASVSEGLPAERAGLAPGDLILAVDGEPVGSFFTFRETVLGSRGRPLELRFARNGKTRVTSIAPERSIPEIEGIEDEVYLIGIQGQNAILRGTVELDRARNPVVAIPRATAMTVERTQLYLSGLRRLVSGEISRRNLGGPIEIAKQSHMALQAGWDRFLGLLILISINLGILNLLPIPILDGGQMLMYAIEGIKRSPLSMRTREMVQQVGLVMIVALLSLAFWNDVSRNWTSFVEWLRGL